MIVDALPLALKNLSKNKLRTVLTVLGIIIGITSVIVVMSAGQAIEGLIVGEVEAFGSNFIQVEIKTPQTNQASAENAFSMVGGTVITTLKNSDAEAIGKHPNISRYYSGILSQDIVSFQNEITKSMVYGVNAAFIDIDQSEIDQGRFFTEEENESLSKVIVLGAKVNEKLFGQTDAIDQSVKLGKQKFKVIGVLEERGASFGFDMDRMVIIPVETLQKSIMGVDYVSFIFAQMKDSGLSASTKADIEEIMRDRHNITDPKKEDFAVTTQEEAMEMLSTIILGIKILLIVLASISLIVGGVGIMNIMYVSVTERTYEIGLRKSVGAKRLDILAQFLAEAIVLTFLGAIIGFMLGVLISWLISFGAGTLGYDWDFSISVSGVILAAVMSSLVGLVFGLYPAQKAAKLEPIQALRR